MYMGVKVTTYNAIYDDRVKVGAAIGIPHWWAPPNGLWCTIDVVQPELEFLVGVVFDDGGVVDTWWYYCEDRELKEIGSKDCVLFRSWYLGSSWVVVLSSSKDMVLSHATKFCNNTEN
jgi:hypothetical protein